jgi:hypothetical protein
MPATLDIALSPTLAKTAGAAPAARFGILPANDETANTAAFAAFAAQADVKSVRLTPGATYRISAVTLPAGYSVIAEGATIIRCAAGPVFTWTDTYEWSDTVSSIATSSLLLYDTGLSPSEIGVYTGTTTVNVLTMGGTRTFKKGDVVKVVSDDVAAGARPGTTNRTRQGEHAIIGADSSSNTATLTSLLSATYSTSVRIAKLKAFSALSAIYGGMFDYDDALAGATDWTEPYLRWFGVRAPLAVGVVSKRGRWPAKRFHGCYDIREVASKTENGHIDGAKAQFGYGTDVVASELGIFIGLTGRNVRHVITTNPEDQPVGSTELQSYGKTRRLIISDSQGDGCGASAFDTHEDAEDIYFRNCTAHGSYWNSRSGGDGFQSRGRRVHFENCAAIRCRTGFRITTYDETTLKNCRAIGITGTPVYIANNGNGGGNYNLRNIKIESSEFEVVAGSSACLVSIGASDGTVELLAENSTFKVAGSPTTSRAFDLTYTTMKYRGIRVDLRDFSGASGLVPLKLSGTSGNDVRGEGLLVLAGGYQTVGALVSSDASSTHAGNLKGVRYEADSSAGDIASAISGNIFNIANQAGIFLVSGEKAVVGLATGARQHTDYVLQPAAASMTPRIQYSADKKITLVVTGTGGVTMADWSTNVEPGAEIVLVNATNGTLSCAAPSITNLAAGAVSRWVRSASTGTPWYRAD